MMAGWMRIVGSLGDTTDDAPYKGTVPLPIDPRMIMIGDQGKREAYLLCPARIVDEVSGRVFFTGKCIADLGHNISLGSLCTRKGTNITK
jgi:hypothetical protein